MISPEHAETIEAPNNDEALNALLRFGYFPDELPTQFSTRNLDADDFQIAIKNIEAKKTERTACEKYNYCLFSNRRRYLKIPNPYNHFILSKVIADNLLEITAHASQSNRDRRKKRTTVRPEFCHAASTSC
jgi:hypothetical protein